ncbi:DUF4442 domain-containing protein [Polaribacter sargassicola]|uniref:DUF4442 domain-containing protein n=1 Tax=Polaribacter sargassicola TaxID=2836891 RepID=UPI001F2E0B67|nr:DUF4442 domain-containing protein [Polaribacter sp. DS7-9]MCG1037135.1 DUF4442 domain-containing protein [Polaribacter sp. DS7-9]
MQITPRNINMFMMFKLPLGFLSGMRVKEVTDTFSSVKIKYKWINQNPFKSMFWAAQGMAAEMCTAVLVMKAIEKSNRKISMLVTHQESDFYKKAKGKIVFTCSEGDEISAIIKKSIETKEGQTIVLTSEGKNEEGVVVSRFKFQWSVKVKL